MALDLFIPAKKSQEEESLATFVRRRLGQEALDRMAQPMVSGIYAADPEQLSLKATFPRFLEMEARYGSVIRGLWARKKERGMAKASGPRYSLFVTLKNGLTTLVQALCAQLPEHCLRLNQNVLSLQPVHNKWKIFTGNGETQEFDVLCLALPAPVAGFLLRSVDEVLAKTLQEISYGSSATLHLAYNRSDVGHVLDAFGFVVPSVENRSIVGCSFSSVKFPGRAPEGKVLLRVFIGKATALEETQLLAAVKKDLSDLLQIKANPLFYSLKHHPHAMPQYTLGHQNRLKIIEDHLKSQPGLFLAGNAFHGLGLPDCIRSGQRAAENTCLYLGIQGKSFV